MRRHVLRTVAVGSPLLGLVALLVTTDYDLADKNAARFAVETFGVANPPPHMASWMLSHPWAVGLALLVAGCIGFLASVAIERIWLARGSNQRQSYRHMWAEIGFLICVFGVIVFGLTLLRGGGAAAAFSSSSAPPSPVPLDPVETPPPPSSSAPIGTDTVWAHPPANAAQSKGESAPLVEPGSKPAPKPSPTASAATEEAKATVASLWRVWVQEKLQGDGASNEEVNGLVLPPDDWMNDRLKKLGRTYRVKAQGSQFMIYNVGQPK